MKKRILLYLKYRHLSSPIWGIDQHVVWFIIYFYNHITYAVQCNRIWKTEVIENA
jgi:hypothetical protein